MLGSQQLTQRWNTRHLHSNDEERRARTIEQLTDKVAPNAFQLIVEALGDQSPLVRVYAAKKLGERRDDRAIEPLLSLALTDNHIDVLRAAMEALAQLNRAKCTQRLMAELETDDSAARRAAGRVLWKLCDEKTDPELVARVGIELGEWKAVSEIGTRALSPLRQALEQGTPRLRREAAEAFVQIGSAEARDTLAAVMNDLAADLNARSVAAWALWQFRWGELPPDDYVRAAIRQGQWNAIRDLGACAVSPLAEALHDADPQIRLKAVDALAEQSGVQAVSALCGALVDPATDTAVRERIARALHKVPDERATEALAAALGDESWLVRSASGRALLERGWTPQEPRLRALFALVREQWGDLEELGAEAVDVLVDALRLPAVNRGAAATLMKIGEAGISALLAAQSDPSAHPVIRELIAITLAGSGDQRALIPLRNMLKDSDVVIRNGAVLTLERLGWQPENEVERAVAAIAHDDWQHVGRIGAAAVEPLFTLVKSGCATKEAVSAFEKVLNKWSGRLPLERVRDLMTLEDPATAAVPGLLEPGTVDCAKLRQLARLELLRRGIVL